MGFSFGHLGHVRGGGGGLGVLGGGSKINFSEHGHVAYQIKGGDH